MMSLLHAFAALFTVLLFLMRRHSFLARLCRVSSSILVGVAGGSLRCNSCSFNVCRCGAGQNLFSKRSSFEPSSSRESSQESIRQSRLKGKVNKRNHNDSARGTSCVIPKYKRDPDIHIDHEHIGAPSCE